MEKPSSETQGQIVGARESLNGRENMARRKVKNGEKSELKNLSKQYSKNVTVFHHYPPPLWGIVVQGPC